MTIFKNKEEWDKYTRGKDSGDSPYDYPCMLIYSNDWTRIFVYVDEAQELIKVYNGPDYHRQPSIGSADGPTGLVGDPG